MEFINLNTSESQKDYKIFIACPIGSDDSPQRKRSDQLLKFIIEPAIKECSQLKTEAALVRSDKIGQPGRITMQILEEIANCDLVIADLTDTNPNVMYEVGVRQALLKPLIFMCQKGQTLPFDLSDLRTVFYELGLEGADQAQEELKKHFASALSGSASAVDKMLFRRNDSNSSESFSDESQGLLAIVQMCEKILHEAKESRELLDTVAYIAADLRSNKEADEKAFKERQQQEMGLLIMQQLLQNPDGAEKAVPALQALAEFGNKVGQTQDQPTLNRAARRKSQKDS